MAALEKLGSYTISGTVTSTSLAQVGSDHILFGSGFCRKLNIQVSNSGQALTDFALQVQEHPDAAWATLLNGTDWATATSLLLLADSSLNTLASGSTSNIHVDVRSAHAVRFQASVASSSTTVTVYVNVGRY